MVSYGRKQLAEAIVRPVGGVTQDGTDGLNLIERSPVASSLLGSHRDRRRYSCSDLLAKKLLGFAYFSIPLLQLVRV
jgi:hypothetical protein